MSISRCCSTPIPLPDPPSAVRSHRADRSVKGGRSSSRSDAAGALDAEGARGERGRDRVVGPAPWRSSHHNPYPLFLRTWVLLVWIGIATSLMILGITTHPLFILPAIGLSIAGVCTMLSDIR